MTEMCRCGSPMTLRDTESADQVAVVRYGCMNGHDRHETVALEYAGRDVAWQRKTQRTLAATRRRKHHVPRVCVFCHTMILRPGAFNQKRHTACAIQWDKMIGQSGRTLARKAEARRRKRSMEGMLWSNP